MARRYRLTFSAVTVAAAQDMVLVTGASGKMMLIRRAWVGCPDTTLATGQDLSLRARFLPATLTVGSGGSVNQTPAKTDPGDATCSTATCGLNNTTKTTTSGTAIIVYSDGCHLFQGSNWRFDEPVPIGPSEAFVYEILGAPSGTVALSGGVEFDEIGG